MKDSSRTNQGLIAEISVVKKRIQELENSEAERKHEGETLRESEEQFRKIFEEAHLGIVITSPSFAFEKTNPAFCRMMGYSADELYSMTFADITHPDHLKQDIENVKKVGRGEASFYKIEKRYIHKSGKTLWGDLIVSSVRDEHGTLRYYLSMVNDITERKRTEEELKKKESYNFALFEYNPEQAIAVDLEGKVIAVNRAKRISGDRLPNIGDVMYRDYASSHEIDMYSELMECLRSGKFKVFPEQKYRGKILLISIAPFSTGAVILSNNITERRLAEKQLHDTLESFRKAVGTTIQVMVSAVETRDPYTSGHQTRSADLARAIAMEMELPQDKIDGIQMAGSIHDIGKLSIPAEILSKPSKLSELEFALIKAHAQRGLEMLKAVESPWPLAEIVYQHHERMDGSGYPRNLKGEEICMEARILAVADVVEAMASYRPYRPGLGIDEALNEIEKKSGVTYDNAVADACLRLFREKGFNLEGTGYKR